MTIKCRAAGFGLEWPGDGMAALLLGGGNQSIFGILGGVGNSGRFGTVRTISTVQLDATSQRYHNQLATVLVWAETAWGWHGGFVFRRGELMIL